MTNVNVNPSNPRFKMYEGKMIIGKTDIEQDNYNCLVFCSRDVKTVKTPNFTKRNNSCAFNLCRDLRQVEIPSDSKLQKIEKETFSNSSLEQIEIPSQVTTIGELIQIFK